MWSIGNEYPIPPRKPSNARGSIDPSAALNAFANEYPKGAAAIQRPGSEYMTYNLPGFTGQYNFLKRPPKTVLPDPAAKEYIEGLSKEFQGRLFSSIDTTTRTKEQIRYNEKNRGFALKQIRAQGFTSDYHTAVRSHNASVENFFVVGSLALLFLIVVLRK
jgi:hypothetical protein